MRINLEMFWSYVKLWCSREKYTYGKLAKAVGMSRAKLWRLMEGKGDITVSEFNAICVGIGLNPLFCMEGSGEYGNLFLADIESRKQ